MVWTTLKEKALNSVFAPLQETLRQKSRVAYTALAITFLLALASLVMTMYYRYSSSTNEPISYWYDPEIVTIDNQAYVTVYAVT